VTRVATESGTIEADAVVLAAGSWVSELRTNLHRQSAVRPIRGQLLRLKSCAPVASRVLWGPGCYIVPRQDGTVLVGATVEELGFDTRVTAGGIHELLREAYRILPEIAELELVETIAGLRPATPDNLPLIGRGAIDGLILATGHFRNGILLAPLTAERITAMLAADRAEVSAR
jgi:glycine oxidase